MWDPYVYTREGQTFTVAPTGIKLVDADGSVLADVAKPVDDITAAGMVLDLSLAGWEPVK